MPKNSSKKVWVPKSAQKDEKPQENTNQSNNDTNKVAVDTPSSDRIPAGIVELSNDRIVTSTGQGSPVLLLSMDGPQVQFSSEKKEESNVHSANKEISEEEATEGGLGVEHYLSTYCEDKLTAAYGRHNMLQIHDLLIRSGNNACLREDGDDAESEQEEKVTVCLKERPPNELEGRQPGRRRALRELKKARKISAATTGEAHVVYAGSLPNTMDSSKDPSFDDGGSDIPFSKLLGSERQDRASSVQKVAHAAESWTQSLPSESFKFSSVSNANQQVTSLQSPTMTYSQEPLPLRHVLVNATPNTTLMLRNIPTGYTRSEFIEWLNRSYKGAYDFLYLPGDQQCVGNRGFAFVSFRSENQAQRFVKAIHNVKPSTILPLHQADDNKTCEVVSARLPALSKTLDQIQANAVGGYGPQAERWLPLLFDEQGEQYDFWNAPLARKIVPTQALDSRALERKMHMDAVLFLLEASSVEARDRNSPKINLVSDLPQDDTLQVSGVDYVKPTSLQYSQPVSPNGNPTLSVNTYDSNRFLPHGLGGAGYPSGYPLGSYRLGLGSTIPPPSDAPTALAIAKAAAAAHMASTAHATMNAVQHHANAMQHQATRDLQRKCRGSGKASKPLRQMSDTQDNALRKQIEFYFSIDNLCKDLYLRSHMNEGGWVPLDLIAVFPKVKRYQASVPKIAELLQGSEVAEVDPSCHFVRVKDELVRSKWSLPVSAGLGVPLAPVSDMPAPADVMTLDETATTAEV